MIIKKVILFLACIVCIQPCLRLLSNALLPIGILPWYKSSSNYLTLAVHNLVGVKNKLKYLALRIPKSRFVVQPHFLHGSPFSTISFQNRKPRIKLLFKPPLKGIVTIFLKSVGQMLPRTESIVCDVRFVLYCTCS